MTHRKKDVLLNTNDVFAAAHAVSRRYSSDTRIADNMNTEAEEEESEEEPISRTLTHPIPNKIADYEIRGTVGEGAFSVVKLAYSPKTKEYYACKVIERIRLKNNLEHRFECEIRVHQQMHHPGIVNLIDILRDDNFYYVFLEFCPHGELFQYIVDKGRLEENDAKLIIKQILEAMKYIHQMGVSHRDMKPENLLIDQLQHTKISDFGLSRFLDHNGYANTPCGSPCYASPECISGSPYDGRTSDCWSCGVILYAMVTGQLPWTKRNQAQLFDQIRRGEYTIPKFLSQTCRNFISSLMCVDYKRRLTAAQALEHPFLTGVNIPLMSLFSHSMPLISLKKVDNLFNLVEDDLENDTKVDGSLILKKEQSMTMIDFERALKEIRSHKPNLVKKRRVVSQKSHTHEAHEVNPPQTPHSPRSRHTPRQESSQNKTKKPVAHPTQSPVQSPRGTASRNRPRHYASNKP